MQLGYNKSFTGSYKASFTNMGQNSLCYCRTRPLYKE